MEFVIMGSNNKVLVFDVVFGCDFSEDLVYQVVVVYCNVGCVGIKVQKICFEVVGIIKKLKKQKGGGVCYGVLMVLIFVGGGVIFVVKLCSFEQKVNCKQYCVVMCVILFELNCQGCLMIVEFFDVEVINIKLLIVKLVGLEVGKCLLIVIEEVFEYLYLLVCNIFYVEVCDVQGLDLVLLVGVDMVVIIVDVVKKVEEWLV